MLLYTLVPDYYLLQGGIRNMNLYSILKVSSIRVYDDLKNCA